MSGYSHCQECGGKLGHLGLFCPDCGLTCCSWDCQDQHGMRHREAFQPPSAQERTPPPFAGRWTSQRDTGTSAVGLAHPSARGMVRANNF